VGEFLVAYSFRNVEDQFSCASVGVYDPNIDGDRRLLWNELARLINWCHLPWCVAGDFLVFLVRDQVMPARVQLWWSF
jgi:hypothetical protein